MECFICGAREDRVSIFLAVIRDGVVEICETCSVREGVPLVRGMTSLQLASSEKNQSVYERLSKMAGLDPKGHKTKFENSAEKTVQQNKSFRQMVEERQKLSFQKQVTVKDKEDLVSNYHWAILQARRAKRLTQKQLAEAIDEPEASIKLVERGILSDDYHHFIRKIQDYLGVTLFSRPLKKDLDLGKNGRQNLSYLEIQEVEQKIEKKKVPFFKGLFGKKKTKEPQEEMEIQELEEDDLSQISSEEMDRILSSR